MGKQVFLASSRKDFCLNGERFACESQKVPSVEGSTALVREVMIKETLEYVTMWVSVSSNCHLFKKFQSHQKPNADFVQERNDQVHRLRKAWSSQIFLFWVLRSCKFPPIKPLGFV
jgi:hypothetical protein